MCVRHTVVQCKHWLLMHVCPSFPLELREHNPQEPLETL